MTKENKSIGKEPFDLEEWYMDRLVPLMGEYKELDMIRSYALNVVHRKVLQGEYNPPLSEGALDAEIEREYSVIQAMTPVQRLALSMDTEREVTKRMAREKREENLRRN